MSREVILRKLDLIIAEIKKLKTISEISLKEYLADYKNYYTAERILEKIIAAGIDINIQIASSKGEKIPDTYYESFMMMAKLKILPPAFARLIADSAKMRNKIAHEYEDIEQDIIYGSLKEAVKEYTKYVNYIRRFLE